MALNCKFGMAVQVMAALAAKGERVSSSDLAKALGTNPVVIRRLTSDLQRAGLVENAKGKQGGSLLARPADRITLDEVYRAVDESDVFHNPSPFDRTCPIARKTHKTLSKVLIRAESGLERELKKTRLIDLLPA